MPSPLERGFGFGAGPRDTPPAMAPHSDTASASSDVLRHVPSPHHRPSLSLKLFHSHLEYDHLHRRQASSFSDSAKPLVSDRRVSNTSVPVQAPSPSPSPATPKPPPRSATAPAPIPAALVRSPIRRKPLSSTASASTLSLVASVRSSADSPALPTSFVELPKPDHRFARPLSVDSPTLYDFSSSVKDPVSRCESPVKPAYVDATAAETTTISSGRQPGFAAEELSDVLSEYDNLISEGSDSEPDGARDGTPTQTLDDSSDDVDSVYADTLNRSPTPSLMLAPKHTPPNLKLDKVDTSLVQDERKLSNVSIETTETTESKSQAPAKLAASPLLNKPLPKSPSQASPLASLFGWGNHSPSVTDFSSIPSPLSPPRKGSTNDALHANRSLSENTKANAAKANPIDYCESYLFTPPPSQVHPSVQVEEMEDELKAISSELAASIRREIDLEDLVDRLQEQVSNPQAPSKRTSDYFSDSGYSSAKLSEYDQSREEIEKIQRRSEQEKASIRLELSNKLQDERSKRKDLDLQIKQLSEKASQIDLAQINNLDANDRVRELERTCEDLRRRLSEERQSKSNFEDLLTALKGELQDACNERDNLRDEVVPQLRARVEGLETEAASYTSLAYESTKMQQQLQSLQQENSTLRNSSGGPPEGFSLSRSNSVAANSFRIRGPAATSALSRSGSVKAGQVESREQLAERLKDVEAQRDALHSALKNLLERQEFQNRENQKKIKILEAERQQLLFESPKKAGFEKDVSRLRTEINVLRRRAEDALEQKWQVEKGLVGLKMDLDRAEEEIASLRALLKEKDILIPPSMARSSGSSASSSAPITSESLERAYRELQDAYSDALERIKKLELGSATSTGTGLGISDEKTQLAMQRLEQSLSAALSERDAARQQSKELRNQLTSLGAVESRSVETERKLADELNDSAQRVEELAAQVRAQLSTNAELRQRLSDTVSRGDAERKANSERISGLQERLHALEEKLVASQTASEDRVARHEEELSQLREAHNEQLRRINSGAGMGMTAPKSPLLKSGASTSLARSSQAMSAKSFEDEVQIKTLRAQVAELEKALADAETEIQQVVAKMSTAQIEVLNLQEEREAAERETRRLQKIIAEEQAKSFEERFKSLGDVVV